MRKLLLLFSVLGVTQNLKFTRTFSASKCESDADDRLFINNEESFCEPLGELRGGKWNKANALSVSSSIGDASFLISRIANCMKKVKETTCYNWISDAIFIESGLSARNELSIGNHKYEMSNQSRAHLKRNGQYVSIIEGANYKSIEYSPILCVSRGMFVLSTNLIVWTPEEKDTSDSFFVPKDGCVFAEGSESIEGLIIENNSQSSFVKLSNQISKIRIYPGYNQFTVIENESSQDSQLIIFSSIYTCRNEIISKSENASMCSSGKARTMEINRSCLCYTCDETTCNCIDCGSTSTSTHDTTTSTTTSTSTTTTRRPITLSTDAPRKEIKGRPFTGVSSTTTTTTTTTTRAPTTTTRAPTTRSTTTTTTTTTTSTTREPTTMSTTREPTIRSTTTSWRRSKSTRTSSTVGLLFPTTTKMSLTTQNPATTRNEDNIVDESHTPFEASRWSNAINTTMLLCITLILAVIVVLLSVYTIMLHKKLHSKQKEAKKDAGEGNASREHVEMSPHPTNPFYSAVNEEIDSRVMSPVSIRMQSFGVPVSKSTSNRSELSLLGTQTYRGLLAKQRVEDRLMPNGSRRRCNLASESDSSHSNYHEVLSSGDELFVPSHAFRVKEEKEEEQEVVVRKQRKRLV